MRVVATAGHVDHGKSTLVLALTGTDPDRFPEEKARGLTIDLGFALCTLPSGREVGFVDVPGHARFVKNMLAGVGAVDVAMLVVAANEGWRPQSEEHLRILDLLDVRHGVVALTKADTVDDETAAIARLEIDEHLAGTALERFAVVTCDGRTGRGLDDLRTALEAALAAAPDPRDLDRPRLWIDRVFAAKGAGTVVTGTLTGGAIAVDDALTAGGRPVRVRRIQQHGTGVDRVGPGERVALNVVGVDHDQLARGDAVIRAGEWRAVDVIDGALTVLPGAAVDRRRRLTAAVGSGEHHVWCRPLDHGYVRVRFDHAVPLAPGDRIVLRDSGSDRTVAGVEVLDVAPTRRAGDAPTRLARELGARVLADAWVPIAGLDARTGLPPAAALRLVERAGGHVVGSWVVAPDAFVAARDRLRAAVADHHRDRPADDGVTIADAARRIGLDTDRVEAVATLDAELEVAQGRLRAHDHAESASTSVAGRSLLAAIAATPLAPPAPDDVALARALVREGVLVELGGIYFSPEAVTDARDRVVHELGTHGSLTVADVRTALGSSRKYVLVLLNHFDATGVTRRRGDDRVPGPRSGLGAA